MMGPRTGRGSSFQAQVDAIWLIFSSVFGWLESRCGLYGIVWAKFGIVDGLGWQVGARCIGGVILACLVSLSC